MYTQDLPILTIHKLTKEQYDREFQAGNIDENALYITPEEDGGLEAIVSTLNTAIDKKADISTVSDLESRIAALEALLSSNILAVND